MNDFIFGTLATEELRLEHVRTHRAGVTHSYARSPLDPLPGQDITLELTIGPTYPLDKAWVYWTADGSDPMGEMGTATNGHTAFMEAVGTEWDTVLWGYIRRYRAVIPGQPAGSVLRYYIGAGSQNGEETLADNGAIYACYISEDPTPTWSQEAVIYQIFVDRFFPGKGNSWLSPPNPAGFYGGTIRGITEKLDYIDSLGVNVLWLTPIFPSPSHHGYDATDLFDIEPRLGTKTDLRELLDEAHGHNLRIILDFVPNHVSYLHTTFQEAKSSRNSPYRNWYIFTHWPDKYQTFFGVPELPQVNLRNPSAKQHILDAAAYWLDFGVDGYRVDYAIGLAPDFWADFRRVTRQAYPDCWTFGEVVEPPDSQLNFEGGLDGCLDFNLMEAFRQAFAFGRWGANQFASFLTRHEAYFPETFSRPSFLDNHDMNRFLWAAGGDLQRLRLAALCQFTLSGSPVIYYGTEVGLSQARDVRQGEFGLPEESRLPMLWGKMQDHELLDYYQRLITFRRNSPELRRGSIRLIRADQDVMIYTRGQKDDKAVVLNLSQEVRKIKLQSEWNQLLLETHSGDVQMERSYIELAPRGGAILSNL